MENLTKIISKKLKGIRAENNLSITEAAKLLDISRETLRKYEKDAASIDCKRLVQILSTYNVEPSYFFEIVIGSLPKE